MDKLSGNALLRSLLISSFLFCWLIDVDCLCFCWFGLVWIVVILVVVVFCF